MATRTYYTSRPILESKIEQMPLSGFQQIINEAREGAATHLIKCSDEELDKIKDAIERLLNVGLLIKHEDNLN